MFWLYPINKISKLSSHKSHRRFLETLSCIVIILLFVCFLSLISLFLVNNAYAKDLGVVGQTYPIAEQDFLEFIQAKLKALEASGEIAKLQKGMQEKARNSADRPHEVSGITRTKTPKQWDFDPSMQLSQDLQNQEGVVFAKKGDIVNPLKTITLHEVLLFYDADDEDQVKWVRNMEQKAAEQNKQEKQAKQGKSEKQNMPNKLILVKGSVLSQTKIFDKPIYFDQQGRLTTRFGITHVPAIVKQDGLVLKISEVLP